MHFPTQPPYVIQTNDALSHVAQYFQIPPDWQSWTGFLDVVGSQPILDKRASFPVMKIARQVYAGDTLGTIADFAGVDAATVGQSNQTLFGIFRTGQTISMPGHTSYTVRDNDTLVSIVQAINDQPGGGADVTVASVSTQVANQRGLLPAGEVLFTPNCCRISRSPRPRSIWHRCRASRVRRFRSFSRSSTRRDSGTSSSI